nr:putative disease resistance RPP13-like protein 1 [Populus alba]
MHKRNNSRFKASQENMTEEPQAAGTSLVGKLICCCLLNPSPVMDTRNEEISSRSRNLENRACGERHHRSAGKRITPTTSLLDRSKVYGRKKDKEFILELLLEREEASNGRVCVVAIGGEEGVGKTTLAQLVYNDSTVANAFDLRAWVFDSEDFDVRSITETILHEVTKDQACKLSGDLNVLQVKLRERLSGKRSLIVLDDACNVGYDQWDLLRQPFAGSEVKIVVTTRNNSVPRIMAAISTRHLEVLSDDDCLSVFLDHAPPELKFDADPKQQAIVAKIASKCNGLPQAAKYLGGRLRSAHCTQWEKIYISNCEIFEDEWQGLTRLITR